jgi:hypothetical protein
MVANTEKTPTISTTTARSGTSKALASCWELVATRSTTSSNAADPVPQVREELPLLRSKLMQWLEGEPLSSK